MNQVDLDYIKKYQFIENIKKLPFVEKVILFGSRARGNQLSRSDIDLAIVCPLATKQEWQNILNIIDAADTLLLVDCLKFDTLDHEIKERILIDGVLL